MENLAFLYILFSVPDRCQQRITDVSAFLSKNEQAFKLPDAYFEGKPDSSFPDGPQEAVTTEKTTQDLDSDLFYPYPDVYPDDSEGSPDDSINDLIEKVPERLIAVPKHT